MEEATQKYAGVFLTLSEPTDILIRSQGIVLAVAMR
jgi:hypothetical protein